MSGPSTTTWRTCNFHERKDWRINDLTAAARQKEQWNPAAEHIDGAICKAKAYQNLNSSIELVAVVAAQAGGLQYHAADAFDWVSDAAAQIARDLRGG